MVLVIAGRDLGRSPTPAKFRGCGVGGTRPEGGSPPGVTTTFSRDDLCTGQPSRMHVNCPCQGAGGPSPVSKGSPKSGVVQGSLGAPSLPLGLVVPQRSMVVPRAGGSSPRSPRSCRGHSHYWRDQHHSDLQSAGYFRPGCKGAKPREAIAFRNLVYVDAAVVRSPLPHEEGGRQDCIQER